MKATVLSHGSAPSLLETRRMVLKHAGFQVKAVISPDSIRGALTLSPFDLLILCHSLAHADCERALAEADLLRPGMKRLILGTALSTFRGSNLDVHLTAFTGPQALIAAVEKLTAAYTQPIIQKDQDIDVASDRTVV